MARPTKLSPFVMRRILQAIRLGNTRDVAAAAGGVTATSLYRWLHDGAQDDAPRRLREFSERFKSAEAAAVMASVGVIRNAARESWQAAAWWLERRYPDEWGRKDRVSVEHILKQHAKQLAEEMGLDESEVLADAERILAGLR